MFDKNEPKITGEPGLINCERAIPVSASAICWARVAGIVTGLIAPINKNGVSKTA